MNFFKLYSHRTTSPHISSQNSELSKVDWGPILYLRRTDIDLTKSNKYMLQIISQYLKKEQNRADKNHKLCRKWFSNVASWLYIFRLCSHSTLTHSADVDPHPAVIPTRGPSLSDLTNTLPTSVDPLLTSLPTLLPIAESLAIGKQRQLVSGACLPA